MEYKLNIIGEDFRIKHLDELNISDYNKIFNIINSNDYYSLLYMLTDIPAKYMNYIPIEEIKKIDWNDILKEDFKAKNIQKQYLGKSLLNLKKIKVGKYIDLDYMLTNEVEDKMENIFALMIIGDDYDVESISELVKEIKNKLSLTDIITPINIFINWRTDIIKQYQSLFNSGSEDEEEIIEDDDEDIVEESQTEYGWLGIVYEESGDFNSINETLDKPLISFLNYLSWKNQKYEKEKEQMNQNKIH